MSFDYLSRNLQYERIYATGRRKLKEPVIWDDGVTKVKVPTGFVCDFASIPGPLRWVASNDDGRIIRPAICHDFMYLTHKTKDKYVSRAEADILFYSMLRKENVGYFKARMMWLAVRVGGFIAWDNE